MFIIYYLTCVIGRFRINACHEASYYHGSWISSKMNNTGYCFWLKNCFIIMFYKQEFWELSLWFQNFRHGDYIFDIFVDKKDWTNIFGQNIISFMKKKPEFWEFSLLYVMLLEHLIWFHVCFAQWLQIWMSLMNSLMAEIEEMDLKKILNFSMNTGFCLALCLAPGFNPGF